MPTISVVINTYNSARFLHKTIDTVLNQTFSDFELIVIDDGSQDETVALANNIRDNRIQVHAYPNGGISKSRNRGISHASGEFIAFLDHDDLWHEQKLEAQLLAFRENPKAALVYSWLEIINQAGEFIRFYPRTRYSGNAYKKSLTESFAHTASNPLMKREAVNSIGGFDEEVYGADDWDLVIRLAEKYDVAFSPHYHIQYRIVQGSGSANVAKLEEGALKVIEKAFRSAPEELQPLKYVALGRMYQGLCFRTLEEMAGRRSGLTAWRYLSLSRQNHPLLWGKMPLAKAIFKIIIVTTLPNALARDLMPWIISQWRSMMTNQSV